LSDIAVNLGPCPKTYPNTPLTKLNAGVAGLDKTLVPITTLRVRICKDATPTDGERFLRTGLIASALLARPAAAALTDETNRLAATHTALFGCFGSASGPEPIRAGPTFFVTFAGRARQVTLLAPFARAGTSRRLPCEANANGFFDAAPTAKWGEQLQLLTTAAPVGPGSAVGTGPSYPTGRR